MNLHIYKIILSAVLSLSFSTGFAKTITGKQCRQLLSPISSIFAVDQRATHDAINDEITNVAGLPLSVIAEKTGKSEVAKNYIKIVKTALNQCASNCQGLPLNNNQKFNCTLLAKDRPMTILNGLKEVLKDDAQVVIADKEENPEAECAFDPTQDKCQTIEPTKVVEVVKPKPEPKVETPIAQAPAVHDCSSDQDSEGCQPIKTSQRVKAPKAKVYRTYKANGFEYSTGGNEERSVEVEI